MGEAVCSEHSAYVRRRMVLDLSYPTPEHFKKDQQQKIQKDIMKLNEPVRPSVYEMLDWVEHNIRSYHFYLHFLHEGLLKGYLAPQRVMVMSCYQWRAKEMLKRVDGFVFFVTVSYRRLQER